MSRARAHWKLFEVKYEAYSNLLILMSQRKAKDWVTLENFVAARADFKRMYDEIIKDLDAFMTKPWFDDWLQTQVDSTRTIVNLGFQACWSTLDGVAAGFEIDV